TLTIDVRAHPLSLIQVLITNTCSHSAPPYIRPWQSVLHCLVYRSQPHASSRPLYALLPGCSLLQPRLFAVFTSRAHFPSQLTNGLADKHCICSNHTCTSLLQHCQKTPVWFAPNICLWSRPSDIVTEDLTNTDYEHRDTRRYRPFHGFDECPQGIAVTCTNATICLR
ncbi:hypothetical protein M9458_000438, partial [Cirrhinus mrigala]